MINLRDRTETKNTKDLLNLIKEKDEIINNL